jgi:hypothetical protein
VAGDRGEPEELPPPDHGRPGDCTRVVAALLEEPEACMAHVRVCGGCDTRSPTCLLCLNNHDTTQCSATGTLPG